MGKLSTGGMPTEVGWNIMGNPLIWHKENVAKIGIGIFCEDFWILEIAE